MEFEEGYWFVYGHESGKVIARQCNSAMQEEKSFTDGNQENITFVSMNYIPTGTDKQVKPVVTYVNDTKPNCWIKDEKWTLLDCSSARFVKQFAIAPDAKHLVEIDLGGVSVDKFPHEFLSDARKQWVGRLSGDHLVVWPKGAAKGRSGGESKTSWLKFEGFNRFVAQTSPGVEILKAAISPAENYIAWLERKSMANEIDLRIYDIKADQYIEKQAMLDFGKDNIKTFALAVTNDGSIILSINDEVSLFNLSGEALKKVPLPSVQAESGKNVGQNITCLELSPDNKRLVIGTKSGRLLLFNLTELSFGKSPSNFYSSVTSCAIDDSGTMVGGFVDGSVMVAEAESDSKSFQLSPLAAYQQFKEPVKAVSIDSQRGYVTALFDWQTSGCTANGLPGQSIRIWGDLKNREKSPLISNSCLPNRRIMTIGSIMEQNNELFLPIAFDDNDVELMPCRGCANNSKSEKPKEVLKRLLKKAEEKKAEIIGDKDLEERYGIKF